MSKELDRLFEDGDANKSGDTGEKRGLGGVIYDSLTEYLPEGIVDTAKGAWTYKDVHVSDLDRIRSEQAKKQARYESAKRDAGETGEVIAETGESLGYSTGTMAGSVAGGLTGAKVGGAIGGLIAGPAGAAAGGTIGGIAGGMGASGVIAARASVNDFLENVMLKTADDFKKTYNRDMTEEEWDRVKKFVDKKADQYGLYEAIPEALGNAFLGPLFKHGTKTVQALLKGGGAQKAVGRFMLDMGLGGAEELATETVTAKGQGAVEAEVGLRDKAPTWGESFTEVAPVTLAQTGAMFVAGRAGHGLYRKLRPGTQTTATGEQPTAPSAPEAGTTTKNSTENPYQHQDLIRSTDEPTQETKPDTNPNSPFNAQPNAPQAASTEVDILNPNAPESEPVDLTEQVAQPVQEPTVQQAPGLGLMGNQQTAQVQQAPESPVVDLQPEQTESAQDMELVRQYQRLAEASGDEQRIKYASALVDIMNNVGSLNDNIRGSIANSIDQMQSSATAKKNAKPIPQSDGTEDGQLRRLQALARQAGEVETTRAATSMLSRPKTHGGRGLSPQERREVASNIARLEGQLDQRTSADVERSKKLSSQAKMVADFRNKNRKDKEAIRLAKRLEQKLSNGEELTVQELRDIGAGAKTQPARPVEPVNGPTMEREQIDEEDLPKVDNFRMSQEDEEEVLANLRDEEGFAGYLDMARSAGSYAQKTGDEREVQSLESVKQMLRRAGENDKVKAIEDAVQEGREGAKKPGLGLRGKLTDTLRGVMASKVQNRMANASVLPQSAKADRKLAEDVSRLAEAVDDVESSSAADNAREIIKRGGNISDAQRKDLADRLDSLTSENTGTPEVQRDISTDDGLLGRLMDLARRDGDTQLVRETRAVMSRPKTHGGRGLTTEERRAIRSNIKRLEKALGEQKEEPVSAGKRKLLAKQADAVAKLRKIAKQNRDRDTMDRCDEMSGIIESGELLPNAEYNRVLNALSHGGKLPARRENKASAPVALDNMRSELLGTLSNRMADQVQNRMANASVIQDKSEELTRLMDTLRKRMADSVQNRMANASVVATKESNQIESSESKADEKNVQREQDMKLDTEVANKFDSIKDEGKHNLLYEEYPETKGFEKKLSKIEDKFDNDDPKDLTDDERSYLKEMGKIFDEFLEKHKYEKMLTQDGVRKMSGATEYAKKLILKQMTMFRNIVKTGNESALYDYVPALKGVYRYIKNGGNNDVEFTGSLDNILLAQDANQDMTAFYKDVVLGEKAPIEKKNKPRLVGVEWLSKDGVKYSSREEGYIDAKVSDWDRAVKSAGSGRNIVHVYLVDDGNGNIKAYGKDTAFQALGLEPNDTASFNKKAKRFIDDINAQNKAINDAIHLVEEHRSNDVNNIVDSARYFVRSGNNERTMSESVIFVRKGDSFSYALLEPNRDKYTREQLENELKKSGWEITSWNEINDIVKKLNDPLHLKQLEADREQESRVSEKYDRIQGESDAMVRALHREYPITKEFPNIDRELNKKLADGSEKVLTEDERRYLDEVEADINTFIEEHTGIHNGEETLFTDKERAKASRERKATPKTEPKKKTDDKANKKITDNVAILKAIVRRHDDPRNKFTIELEEDGKIRLTHNIAEAHELWGLSFDNYQDIADSFDAAEIARPDMDVSFPQSFRLPSLSSLTPGKDKNGIVWNLVDTDGNIVGWTTGIMADITNTFPYDTKRRSTEKASSHVESNEEKFTGFSWEPIRLKNLRPLTPIGKVTTPVHDIKAEPVALFTNEKEDFVLPVDMPNVAYFEKTHPGCTFEYVPAINPGETAREKLEKQAIFVRKNGEIVGLFTLPDVKLGEFVTVKGFRDMTKVSGESTVEAEKVVRGNGANNTENTYAFKRLAEYLKRTEGNVQIYFQNVLKNDGKTFKDPSQFGWHYMMEDEDISANLSDKEAVKLAEERQAVFNLLSEDSENGHSLEYILHAFKAAGIARPELFDLPQKWEKPGSTELKFFFPVKYKDGTSGGLNGHTYIFGKQPKGYKGEGSADKNTVMYGVKDNNGYFFNSESDSRFKPTEFRDELTFEAYIPVDGYPVNNVEAELKHNVVAVAGKSGAIITLAGPDIALANTLAPSKKAVFRSYGFGQNSFSGKINELSKVQSSPVMFFDSESNEPLGIIMPMQNMGIPDRKMLDRVLDQGDRRATTGEQEPEVAEQKTEEVTSSEYVRGAKEKPQEEIAQRIGEHIGGSKADLAAGRERKPRQEKIDDGTPAWRKKYIVIQSANTGKYELFKQVNGRLSRIGIMNGWTWERFDTEEEALAALPGAAVRDNHSVMQTSDGTYAIFRNTGPKGSVKKHILLFDGFKTEEEANKFMDEHVDEIFAKRPGMGEGDLAIPTNPQRTGRNVRNHDVSGEDFMREFGFRGVEFGVWQNQVERQNLLNAAYDAMSDLAYYLHVPNKALSLNGTLAMAFGARGNGGKGGVRAHYEPDKVVINLTKMSGAGSLAHEWLHALDNYFGEKWTGKRYGAKAGNYLSHRDSARSSLGDVREETAKAFLDLMNTIRQTVGVQYADTEKLQKMCDRRKEWLEKSISELRATIERTAKSKKKDKNLESELRKFDEFAKQVVEKPEEPRPVFPKDSRATFAKPIWTTDALTGMSDVVKALTGRAGQKSDGSGAVDSIRLASNGYRLAIEAVESAKKEPESTVQVDTNFLTGAKALDKNRSKPYWSTDHEMLARAFSAYIEDIADKQNLRSDFLSYGSSNDKYPGVSPFPSGVERAEINSAFTHLFNTLQIVETDQGLAFASVSMKGIGKGISSSEVHSAVDDVDKKFGTKTEVVDSFDDLPEEVRATFSGDKQRLEGVNYRGTVYLVAGNLRSAERASEVWMHEHVGHNGFESLMSAKEKTQLTNRLFAMLGGVDENNASINEIKRIAAKYRFDLSTENGRDNAMREFLASLAEKEKITDEDKVIWKRVWNHIAATLRKAWHKVTGNNVALAEDEIRDILKAMKRQISQGEQARKADTMNRIMESYNLSREDAETVARSLEDRDNEYFDAIARGDMDTVARMVRERAEALGFTEAIPEQTNAFRIRTGKAPSKTKKVYKVFTVADDGSPTALFVAGDQKLPQGVWLDAVDSWHIFDAKSGLPYVPSTQNPYTDGGKTGTPVNIRPEDAEELVRRGFIKSAATKQVTGLSYRPGWHFGSMPFFPQGGKEVPFANHRNGKTNKKTGDPIGIVHRWNQVVFECELDATHDYTEEARAQEKAKKKNGEINAKKADLQYMPEGGYYEYTTNPTNFGKPERGLWYISGSLKIGRALTQEECDAMLRESGVMVQEWEGGEDGKSGTLDLASLGYTGEQKDAASKTLAPITYDDNGSVIPLSQRFNPSVDDVRYSIADATGTQNTVTISDAIQSAESKANKNWMLEAIKHPGKTIRDFRAISRELGEKNSDEADAGMFKTFRQGFWLGRKVPAIKAMMEAQTEREENRAKLTQDFTERFTEVYSGLSEKAHEYLRNITVQLDRVGQVNPETGEQEENPIKLKNNKFNVVPVLDDNGNQITDADGTPLGIPDSLNESYYIELARKLKAQGNKERIEDREAFDAACDAYVEQRRAYDGMELAYWKHLDSMKAPKNVIDEIRQTMADRPFYYPHMRYGNWAVVARDAEGNTLERIHFDALTKTSAKLQAGPYIDALKDMYPDAKIDLDPIEKLPEDAFESGASAQNVMTILNEAVTDIEKGEGKQLPADLRDKIAESAAKIFLARGIGQRQMHRTTNYVAGFQSDNLMKTMVMYASGLSGAVTKYKAANDFSQILGGYLKENARPTPARNRNVTWMKNFITDMMRNTDSLDRKVDFIKSGVYMYFLGGNIKSGLVNLTQNPTIGLPLLAADMGTAGATIEYLKGARKGILAVLGGQKNAGNVKGLTDEENKFLDQFWNSKEMRDTYARELRSIVGGAKTRIGQKTMALIGAPMEYTERFNRMSYGLTVFRAALDGKITNKQTCAEFGQTPGKAWDFDSAFELAKLRTRMAHGGFGKGERAEFFRHADYGRVANIGATFKSIMFNNIELWKAMLHDMGPAGKKAFALSMASHMVFGGAAAIPLLGTFAPIASMALSSLFGGDDDPEKYLKSQLGESSGALAYDVLMYGVPAAGGVTIKGSLATEMPLGGIDLSKGWATGMALELNKAMFGAAFSIAQKPEKALEAFSHGRYQQGMEYIIPTAVANVSKAERLYLDGDYTAKGRPIPDKPGEKTAGKLTGQEAALQAIGFATVKKAKAWDRKTQADHRKEQKANMREELVTRWINASNAKDQREVARVVQDWKKWNADHKDNKKMQIDPLPKLAKQALRPIDVS